MHRVVELIGHDTVPSMEAKLRAWTKWVLCGAAFTSAAVLSLRGVFGPFEFLVRIHNPLNPECVLALSILLLLLISQGLAITSGFAPRGLKWPAIMVGLAAAAAYTPALSLPLVTDDYIHIRQISSGEAPTPLGCLTHACGGPLSFRPVGFATYWAEWDLWKTAALPRHAFDLVLQVVTSLLFLVLVRRLGVPPPIDWLAGLLFALNGIRAETVAWPSARFDTLALLFSLLAGLVVLRGAGWGVLVSMAATAGACLSKESAYVLPVLLALLLGRRIRTRAGWILVGANFAVAVAVFVWRWLVLKGIGGYQGETGAPKVLQFDAIKLAKTFLWRVWGVLWFPINWSRPLEVWMMLGLAAGIVGSLMLINACPDRARLWACALGVLVACIPAHHLLLIGPSLEQSRYLTYATPAFVLLIAAACRGLRLETGVAALSLLIAFHAAALQHNLRIWQSIASARYELCQTVAGLARNAPGAVAIDGLPETVDGVYWRNGLEDCLAMDFGIPMGKVLVNRQELNTEAPHLHWDPDARALR